MATLLEKIRGNLSQQATQPKAGMEDQGEKVRKLLGAKTGKASSQAGSQIGQSNLAEASAVDQTRLGQDQLAQEGQVQAQQIAQQEQGLQNQETLGREKIDLQQRANELQNVTQTEELLNNLQRDRDSLDLDKDRARLEQLAQNLAFEDKQYVDQLQRAGEVNRLDDSLEFSKQLARSTFSDNLDILNEDLAQKAATAQSMRAYDKVLTRSRLADMLKTGQMLDDSAAQRARYESLGSLVSAGAQAYSAFGGGKSSAPSGNTVDAGNSTPTTSSLASRTV